MTEVHAHVDADADALPGGEPSAAPARPPASRRRRAVAVVLDVLALALVLVALLAPDQLGALSPAAFLRIPVEGLVAVALVLVLPRTAGRVVAGLGGAALGLLAIGKVLDMGFFAVLVRPFDPVLDWAFVGDAVEFVQASAGRAGAVAAMVGAVLLVVAVLALVTLSALRLAGLVRRRRTAATRTLGVLTVGWLVCALLGVQIAPGQPVAARSAAVPAYDRVLQVVAGERDKAAFAAQARTDAFRSTPGGQLLTGLRGKDVVLTFVESYGRSAVSDPGLDPQINALLDAGTRRLRAAGFAARSAFLTSPTFGGGSWLAHSTLLSGLWIDNQQRYSTLVASDRFTLNRAFHQAGWRTVGVMPGVTRAWPEAGFYGYDRVYDSRDMGYRGPHFSWAPMPDQYALSVLQRAELAPKGRAPVMAELPMVSSHAPWAPLPDMVSWEDVGDGSVFDPMPAAGDQPGAVWPDASRVRAAYAQSIAYSLQALISYVATYGNDNLVLVFLGDHQPASIVTGPGASHDVPITIVARDPKVLDRISGWGWQDGLRPAPQAPVWRMDAFRDRFLTAFGTATASGR